MSKDDIIRAIEAKGGYAEVARLLGTKRQYIHRWANTQCPPRHVCRLAKVLGLPKSKIRPDIFEDRQ